MRHQKKKKVIDRKAAARQGLLRSLVLSLIIHEKIKTTETKAKYLRSHFEKLITIAKKGDLNARRQLLRFIPHYPGVKKMVEVIGPRYKERKGGYLRLVKIGRRQGDRAPIVKIELV